jgi:hypothetical protein
MRVLGFLFVTVTGVAISGAMGLDSDEILFGAIIGGGVYIILTSNLEK